MSFSRIRYLLPILALGLTNLACNNELEHDHCLIDYEEYVGTGKGASARTATDKDLMLGDAARGRPGDTVIENDQVRFIIEAPGRTIAPQPFGGNIIDAGLKGNGTPVDRFGELGAFYQFGRTIDHEVIEVVRDGSDGGAAIVAATGSDKILDFINLPGMIGGSGLEIPDVDSPLNLQITTWYVLPPESRSIKVIQAVCNKSDKATPIFGVGDMIDSGGEVGYYSTGTSNFPGKGSISDIAGVLASDFPPEKFVGWIGEDVAYGYFADGPFMSVIIAGVTVTLHGEASITDWIGHIDEAPNGALSLAPGEQATVIRDFVVGDSPSELYDYYYKNRAPSSLKTGSVKGKVLNANGKGEAGVRVLAYTEEGGKLEAHSLFTTNSKGEFEGTLPQGEIRLVADNRVVRSEEKVLKIESGKQAKQDLKLPAQAFLTVKVRDEAGKNVPGKVTVQCDGACELPRSDSFAARFRDVTTDSLPANVFEIAYLGTEAETSFALAPGSYKVWVSRGPEWSLDSIDVSLAGGESKEVTGTISHVVDTTGWVSADFHVHAINSPDSAVPNIERLKTFMAEGAEVLVATDHDFVTDFTPFLKKIPDGDKHLKTVVGVEITTFDYGHYNAFPLVRDNDSRNGGAIDWAGGKGEGMTPGDIFAAAKKLPGGEKVIQLNHARSGMFSMLGIDTIGFYSRAQPSTHRIRDVKANPDTGDTGLFDDAFTAIEIFNGTSQNGLADSDRQLMNDWFSMLSRGMLKTATAVSDTHQRHGESGYPRSYVELGVDKPKDVDTEKFAKAVNAGKVTGTTGPFVLATAKVGSEKVGLGGTLKSNGQPVTLDVEVRTPHWMSVNRARVFMNATGTETDEKGNPKSKLPEAAASATLSEEEGGDGKSRTYKASFTLEPEKDAWIVVLVEGDDDLFPVVGKGGVLPVAYTNAIYVDVDGKGWTPPVDLKAERKRLGKIQARAKR